MAEHSETDRLIPLEECFGKGGRLGIGRTRGYEELAAGRLRAKKVGRRTFLTEAEIRRFIDALPAAVFTAAG